MATVGRFMLRGRTQRGAVQLGALLAVAGVACGGVGVGFAGQRLTADAPDPATAGTSRQVVELAAHACPQGTSVGALHSGDRVFVTARSSDGAWLRIRNPLVPSEVWWVGAEGLDAQGPIDDLPVADCGSDPDPDHIGEQPEVLTPPEETTTAPGTSQPGEDAGTPSSTSPSDEVALPAAPGATVPATVTPPGVPPTSRPGTAAPPTSASPTTRPPSTTRPPATVPPTTQPPATTAAPPDVTGPSLSAWLGGAELWEADGGGISCGSKPRTTTVSATVSDPSGVSSVTAHWQVGNHQGSVTLNGGGTRTATVGPHGYHTLPSMQDRVVTVTVTAVDGAGNQSSDSASFTLHSTDWCFG